MIVDKANLYRVMIAKPVKVFVEIKQINSDVTVTIFPATKQTNKLKHSIEQIATTVYKNFLTKETSPDSISWYVALDDNMLEQVHFTWIGKNYQQIHKED